MRRNKYVKRPRPMRQLIDACPDWAYKSYVRAGLVDHLIKVRPIKDGIFGTSWRVEVYELRARLGPQGQRYDVEKHVRTQELSDCETAMQLARDWGAEMDAFVQEEF